MDQYNQIADEVVHCERDSKAAIENTSDFDTNTMPEKMSTSNVNKSEKLAMFESVFSKDSLQDILQVSNNL